MRSLHGPLGRREQEELGSDELVAALGGFLVGEVEEPVEVARDGEVALGSLHLGHALDQILQGLPEGGHVGPGALHDRGRAAVLLVEEGEQQVLGLDEAVVVGEREALGVGQGLLELGGQFVDSHGCAALKGSLNTPLDGCGAPVFNPLFQRWK